MSRVGTGRWYVAMLGVTLAASGCQKVNLEVTAHGGFAYVRNGAGTVDIGFLNTVKKPTCDVPQLGVDLKIDDGRIVSGPPNLKALIDVSDADVTFDGIGSGAVALTGNGLNATTPSAPMPVQPSPRFKEDDWRDVYWVPHTRLNYLNTRVDPNWLTTKVQGYARLAGGSLSGGVPSDGAALQGFWEFKTSPTDLPAFKQAITDRTRFRTKLSGKTVVINVKHRGGATDQITVEPIDARNTVSVLLLGRHAENAPVTINPGDKINDFCTFYEILEQVPPVEKQLAPYWAGPTAVIGSNAPPISGIGQPTPGLYCPGDWP